jgi:hypothetical protein
MKNSVEPFLSSSGSMTQTIAVGAFILLFASAPFFAAAQDNSNWKHYRNSEYRFEIAYPTDWQFDASYENNYDKPPSGKQAPAYAGETRNLFSLEMDGPTQSHEGGGSFDDGASVTVRITGTSGGVEDWNIRPNRPWYLLQSTPSEWVKLHSSPGSGDGVKRVAVNTNGFTGAIELVCTGTNPCKLFEEAGGAYRTLPSGRVLLISWDRMTGANDFSYRKYFLPMLSSFKLLK